MTMKKLFAGALMFLLILLSVLVFNRLTLSNYKPAVKPVVSVFEGEHQIAETLSALIQFQTVSHAAEEINTSAQFAAMLAYLKKRFPGVHENLRLEKFNDQALLYTWQGSDASLKPMMLVAHYDVVPNLTTDWQHDAFSGHIDENYVWGRGAMDDKSAFVAIFHAIEKLISQGFTPRRSVILAFGGDEEVGGIKGAKIISEHLQSRDVTPEFILDEGMPITDGIMKGVARPVAMIGIAEKGSVNVSLTATATEGHSAAPPRQTAVGKLANAISKLEAAPMPAKITQPIAHLFDSLALDMPLIQSLVVSNRWLFEYILTGQLAKENSTNALIRTTFATTMIAGSPQENVLPKTASAVINVRILPENTIEQVLAYIKQTINDQSITVTRLADGSEASQVSGIDTLGYRGIADAIAEVYPDILVAPSLLIAGTDSKHYQQLSNNIYRFRPLWIRPDDISRFHGTNERIGMKNLQQMTLFYFQLLSNLSGNQAD